MNLALGTAFDSNFCCTVLVPHLCSRIRVVVPGKRRALSIPVLQVRAACSNKSISANPVGWAAIPNFNLSIVLEYSESSCELDTWQERLRHERATTPGVGRKFYHWRLVLLRGTCPRLVCNSIYGYAAITIFSTYKMLLHMEVVRSFQVPSSKRYLPTNQQVATYCTTE